MMSVCLSLQGSFKEEPFQFSGQQDPSVQTDRQKDRYCQFIIRIKTPYSYFIQVFFLFFGGSVSHPSIKQLKTTTGPIFTYSYYIQELEKEDKAPSHPPPTSSNKTGPRMRPRNLFLHEFWIPFQCLYTRGGGSFDTFA